MPELPEVESVRKQLDPQLSGRRILDVWSDPHPNVPRQFMDLDLARGRTVQSVGRRGKFLIAPLDDELDLIMHLGMTGSFRFDEELDHIRAKLWLDDKRTLVYRDARRFGRMIVVKSDNHDAIPALRNLGPEPLSDDFDKDRFAKALASTRAPIKTFLLSQRPVAGVGNIYADEALWISRIHPASRRVGAKRAGLLHDAIVKVLSESIDREGTTFRDFEMVDGETGRNATFLFAYGRAGLPCPRCTTPMRRVVLGGRGTTYCPRCQH